MEKPTLEEVEAYCRERSSTVDPEAFYDYYTANGWVQGRGTPMRDWKAAVRTWEARDRGYGKTKKKDTYDAHEAYVQNGYDRLPF